MTLPRHPNEPTASSQLPARHPSEGWYPSTDYKQWTPAYAGETYFVRWCEYFANPTMSSEPLTRHPSPLRVIPAKAGIHLKKAPSHHQATPAKPATSSQLRNVTPAQSAATPAPIMSNGPQPSLGRRDLRWGDGICAGEPAIV